MNTPEPALSAVFDTNICLDFFIFHDPVSCQLLNYLKTGKLLAVTRTDCREEFLTVLDYPKLALSEHDKEQAIAGFDHFMKLTDTETKNRDFLPICKDPDDQKFLETAFDTNAKILFTKDKALLKLARHNRKRGLFRIISPRQWLIEMKQESPEAPISIC